MNAMDVMSVQTDAIQQSTAKQDTAKENNFATELQSAVSRKESTGSKPASQRAESTEKETSSAAETETPISEAVEPTDEDTGEETSEDSADNQSSAMAAYLFTMPQQETATAEAGTLPAQALPESSETTTSATQNTETALSMMKTSSETPSTTTETSQPRNDVQMPTAETAEATDSSALQDLLKKQDATVQVSQTKSNDTTALLEKGAPVFLEAATDTETATQSISQDNILASMTEYAEEIQQPTSRTGSETTKLDVNNQFLNARMQQQNTQQMQTQEQTGDPGNQNQDTGTAAQSELATVRSSTGLANQESDSVEQFFSQTFQTISGSSEVQTTVTTPAAVQTTSYLSETSILEQVTNSFNSSQLTGDSKIVIKLNPAELGELKINIQLKDGSVHAGILTQNAKVQEILEKNLPKLKSMMEENGLSVSEIAVTVQDDQSSQFSMFEETLSQNSNSYSDQNSAQAGSSIFDEEQENFLESLQSVTSQYSQQGLNVTA